MDEIEIGYDELQWILVLLASDLRDDPVQRGSVFERNLALHDKLHSIFDGAEAGAKYILRLEVKP